jgi:hypothetical protein
MLFLIIMPIQNVSKLIASKGQRKSSSRKCQIFPETKSVESLRNYRSTLESFLSSTLIKLAHQVKFHPHRCMPLFDHSTTRNQGPKPAQNRPKWKTFDEKERKPKYFKKLKTITGKLYNYS